MIKVFYDRVLRPVLSAHDSPEAVAGGVALGLGIALTPTMGIQMPIAWLVATLCGANRVVAVAMVWISNPLTVAPLYYSEYLLGAWMLGRGAVTSYHEFQELWVSMAEQSYLDRLRELSDALLLPLVVGSMTPAVLLGAAAYPASLWSLRRYRRRQADRRAQAAAAAEAAVEPVPAALERPGPLAGPKAQAGMLLLAGLLALSGCLDGNGTLTQPGVRVEDSLQGRRQVWTARAGGADWLLAPLFAGTDQDEFSTDRLERFLGEVAGQHRFASLRVYQFDEPTTQGPLGTDGIPLTMQKGAGRWSSVPPSTLLSSPSVRSRSVLSSLLGASSVPGLVAGQALRLLVALPGDADWEGADSIHLALTGSEIPMRRHELSAQELHDLLNSPRKERFDLLMEGQGP